MVKISLKTAPRKMTADGVWAAVAVALVVAYLIAPQFVAGLIWDAVNMAVNFWAVS